MPYRDFIPADEPTDGAGSGFTDFVPAPEPAREPEVQPEISPVSASATPEDPVEAANEDTDKATKGAKK